MVSPAHFVFLLLQLFALATSVHGADLLYHFCGSTGNFAANSTYEANLKTLLASIAATAAVGHGFYNLSAGWGPGAVNALTLCRGDVGATDCRGCLIDSAAGIARQCPVQKEAVLRLDHCMLRYSNRSIFGVMEALPAL